MKILNRACSTEQKKEIIDRLLLIWIEHEHLRLGQLIENAFIDQNLYNIEDYDLINLLEKLYK